jgi:antitoxin MazE
MKGSVKKWGNSAAVSLPAEVLEAAHLQVGDDVNVHGDPGRIVIEPLGVKSYKVADLVNQITPDNLHELVDFGPPQGREVW